MSISQMKKQFEEFAAYLGRDVTGLGKLRTLKCAFNELRAQLASAEAESSNAVATKEYAFGEATKAKSDLTEARQEIHRLQQKVANLTREAASQVVVNQDDEGMNDASRSLSQIQKQYLSSIKELRKHLNLCPPPVSATNMTAQTLRYYDRNAIAQGWSHQALWVLGASVAILAAFHGEVAITSDGTQIYELEPMDEDVEKRKHQTLQWMRKNINTDDDHDPLREIDRQSMVNQAINAQISRTGGGSNRPF